jgi:hypothetical protein
LGRLLSGALAGLLAVSACRIERTPPEFLEERDPATSEVQQRVGEIRARLALSAQTLARGNLLGATSLLRPARLLVLIPPDAPAKADGAAAVYPLLARLLPPDSARGRLERLEVNVAPNGSVAWFAGELHAVRRSDGSPWGEPWRVSGVYLLEGGEWELVQLHVSRRVLTSQNPPPDSTAAEE